MRRRKPLKTILLFITMLVFMGLAQAADLMNVYQLAVNNDAHLQAARYEFKASSEAIDQAIAGLLPVISAEGSYTKSEQEIISSDNTVFDSAGKTDFTTQTYGITMNMPVFRFDAWLQFSQSFEIVKQAKAELLAAQQQLMFDIAESYFSILAAKDNLEFSSAEKKALFKQLELAQERTQHGLGTEVDLLDTQSRYASSKSQEIEAINTLNDSYRGLQEFTQELVLEFNTLQENIPLIQLESETIDDWISISLKQNYALEAKRHALAVAKEEKIKQYGGHLPTLDLIGSFNNRDTKGSLFGGGSEVETADIKLQMNVPLFQGGKILSQTREADFRYKKVKFEYEAERRTLERETRAAYHGVLSGIQKVEALEKAVQFQASALEVKEEGFKAGMNTILEILDAQRDLYFAQKDYSQARYDYLLSVLSLKKSVGTLNPVDLETLNKLLKG